MRVSIKTLRTTFANTVTLLVASVTQGLKIVLSAKMSQVFCITYTVLQAKMNVYKHVRAATLATFRTTNANSVMNGALCAQTRVTTHVLNAKPIAMTLTISLYTNQLSAQTHVLTANTLTRRL